MPPLKKSPSGSNIKLHDLLRLNATEEALEEGVTQDGDNVLSGLEGECGLGSDITPSIAICGVFPPPQAIMDRLRGVPMRRPRDREKALGVTKLL
jgi:hypothetical protein